ncbi:protein roadkill-like [Lucilia sericata]|uniref:protein roadkill-like n=1 Tax=Lucilia sericata TaxID=13632 RepID=UPI0018A882C8|nr:protein roadkill-like [Lucilia sericata]
MSLNNKPIIAWNWCSTQQEILKICFTWTISNFGSCNQLRDEWKSPTFSSAVNGKYKCCLLIKRDKEFFQFYLLFLDPIENLIQKFKYRIYLSKANKENPSVYENVVSVGKNDVYHVISLRNSHILDKTKSLLPEDNLKIHCEITFSEKVVNISRQSISSPKCALTKDFGNLLQNGIFADVTLVVDDKEFHVHKAILAARSPVFAAMFEHEMKEQTLNRVEITDIDGDILQEMLRFIYTGKVINIAEIAKFLLPAADKYAIESLKKFCEVMLNDKISIETAVETLILADRHSAQELKINAIAFINSNATEVMKTQDWENMIKTHSYLIAETYQAFAEKQYLALAPKI